MSVEEAVTRTIDRRVATLAMLLDKRVGDLEEKMARFAARAAASASGFEGDPRAVAVELARTPEWKEFLDRQFKAMSEHLEREVIPRVILRLLTSEAPKTRRLGEAVPSS
jgi:hypothetical protein